MSITDTTTQGTIDAGALFSGGKTGHAEDVQRVGANPTDAAAKKDIWNANKFAARYEGKLIYVFAEKVWYRWNDIIWERCTCDEQVEAAKDYVHFLFAVLLPKCRKDHDADRAEKFAKHCAYSSGKTGIDNMLKLARSDSRLAVESMAAFDKDPWLFQTANGVINLKTGAMLEPDPKLMISRCSPVNFVRDAQCPLWEKYLADVFPDDPDTADFMQRFMGYSLSGDVSEEKMLIELGVGSNGKSVRESVHRHIMGSYARAIPSSVVAAPTKDDDGERATPAIAALCGVRYGSINETQAGDILHENAVKRVAGTEAISARQLYGPVFEFQPTAKISVRTNHRPIVKGTDTGIWRRLALVRYGRVFDEDERDIHLSLKLVGEAEGILVWMVAGFQKWQARGLKLSPKMAAEVAAYRVESDILGEFLSEYPQAPLLKVEEATLYSSEYKLWCQNNGHRPMTKNSFTRQLSGRGIGQDREAGVRWYVGIGPKPAPQLRRVV